MVFVHILVLKKLIIKGVIVSMIYGIHVLTTLVFVLLLLLPFYSRKLTPDAGSTSSGSLNFWRIVFHIAHLMLIVSLATGIWMAPSYTSSWFWLVIIVFLAMGAFLGISAKSLRLVAEGIANRTDYTSAFRKLNRFSLLLSVTITIMVVLMTYRW